MRGKSPLTLMEQLVMILVFALAAALCLQIFVFADRASARNEKTDRAVLACQNTAETIKAANLEGAAHLLGGTFSYGVLSVRYDENWELTETDCTYLLQAEPVPSPIEGLGKAHVRVAPVDTPEEVLFELTVGWQEVSADE